jgi:NTP pyrophosphatase (non-canonical NTP hydrolase)
MDLKEYADFVKTQWNSTHRTEREQMVQSAMGLSGEAGEVLEWHKKKFFHDRDMTRDALVSELGDVLYYFTQLANLHNVSLEEIIKINTDKILARRANKTGCFEKRS